MKSYNEPTPPLRQIYPEAAHKIIPTAGKKQAGEKTEDKNRIYNPGVDLCRIGKINIQPTRPDEMKMLSHTELYNLLQIKKRSTW